MARLLVPLVGSLLLCVSIGCGDLVTIDARDGSVGGADAGPMFDAGEMMDTGVPMDAGPDAPPALHPAFYAEGSRHSPLTPFVAENLRAVAARADDLQDDVFSKVGASTTVSTSFLHCFAGGGVDLDGRDLADTVAHFAAGDAAGTTPYTRESDAATVGWHAGRAIEGSPSPLEREVEAARPRFAVIQYGTNDINIVTREQYANNMLDLTDQLLDRGVIPVLSSIQARGDDPAADAEVPVYNLAVRAIAQARQVPFIDLHRELAPLPGRGLGPDDIHLNAFSGGACVLTSEGLQFGYNVRNLLTIEAFDRLRRVVVAGEGAPDPAGPRIAGDGSEAAPFVVPELPFTHLGNTLFSDHRNLDEYTGCAAAQDESGPELLYRLELSAPTRVLVLVFDRGNTDVDIHLLSDPSEAGCVGRAHREFEADLLAGTHFFSVDTFVSSDGTERAGEYLFAILPL